MGKLFKDGVATEELPVDVEATQEPQRKRGWIGRVWGKTELDVKERKYVRKVDLYLL